MTIVDSIEIPAEFVELAKHWHGGQDDMLYAVASTGGLTIGNRMPMGVESDQEWYASLWSGLAADIRYAVRSARKSNADDLPALELFLDFAYEVSVRLMTEYGLDD